MCTNAMCGRLRARRRRGMRRRKRVRQRRLSDDLRAGLLWRRLFSHEGVGCRRQQRQGGRQLQAGHHRGDAGVLLRRLGPKTTSARRICRVTPTTRSRASRPPTISTWRSTIPRTAPTTRFVSRGRTSTSTPGNSTAPGWRCRSGGLGQVVPARRHANQAWVGQSNAATTARRFGTPF